MPGVLGNFLCYREEDRASYKRPSGLFLVRTHAGVDFGDRDRTGRERPTLCDAGAHPR